MSSGRFPWVRKGTVSALALAGVTLLVGTAPSAARPSDHGFQSERPGRAKNVILFIADGYSDGAITATRLLHAGKDGRLALDTFANTGDMSTHSANSLITDFAASATAMATGYKVDNGVVSLGPDGDPLTTAMEVARAEGKAACLVSTSYITDASTAAWLAHVANRGDRTLIAEQLLAAGPEVIMGGGEDHFIPNTETGAYPSAGDRTDGRNLITEAQEQGYVYLPDPAGLSATDCGRESKVFGLFGDYDLWPRLYDDAADPSSDSPSLAAMTTCAIQVLANDRDGFLLVVEEEGTDELAHDTNAEATLAAGEGFDDAVQAALEFARERRDTLVIATANHETGGFAVSGTGDGYGNDAAEGCPPGGQGPFTTPDGDAFCGRWISDAHTGEQVRIAAEGPSSYLVEGRVDNTDVFGLLLQAMRLSVDDDGD